MAKRITIDPITRIEGHLRIDCEIDNGKVVNAWSSGQMWRGIEIILKGRDPWDAPTFTQRICGVCTTVHDHIVHFYLLSAVDWVDIPSALKADPKKAAALADPHKPLEVLHTVHSFDPCLACAIHLVDATGREIGKVKAL